MTRESHKNTIQRLAFEKWLVEHNACRPAMKWLAGQPTDQSLQDLYADCPPSYLVWAAYEAGVDIWTLVLAACDCARTVATTPGEHHALDLAVRRAQGDLTVTAEGLRRAAYAADARTDAAARAAAYAARAAACADDDSTADDYAADAVTAAYTASASPEALGGVVRARIPFDLISGHLDGQLDMWCPACAEHYGDDGICDLGMPQESPHRKEPK